MKDRKLRVRVNGIPRDFYLYKRKGQRAFYIKFVPPLEVRQRLGVTRLIHSTKSSEPAAAVEIAARFIEQHWSVEKLYEAGTSLQRRQGSFASLEEILARYEPLPRDVDPKVKVKNKNSMRILVREGVGRDYMPRSMTAVVFADDAVIKNFQRARMDAARHRDLVRQESAAGTVNSTVNQARSIFARDRMHLYDGLVLPDLTAFRAATALPVDKDVSFVPFPPDTIERIERELPAQSRNVQLTCLLMMLCGLRNTEVEHGKWEWFRRFTDGTAELSIERRPYFKVKNNTVRTIQLDAEQVSRLLPYWGAADEWWISGRDATARYDATHDEINDWLRPIIPDRTKCAYELRKHAASMVLTRPESEGGGLAAAARFLGDTIQVTERVYARFLKPVHAVRSSELRAKFEVVRTAA